MKFKDKINILHDVGTFGLIIPMKNKIWWEHQTDGCACHHIFVEGVFIPLCEPFSWDKLLDKKIDYLDDLTLANYDYNKSEIKRIWKKINKKLDFEYKEIESQKGQPNNQEGIKWIKITKIKYPKKSKYSNYESNCFELDKKYKSLINKEIALIYPNCD